MKAKVIFVTPENLPLYFDGLSVKTLANFRSLGKGPRFYRRGRRIFYRLEDVERWLTQNETQTIDS
jgi:hypothetical protein